MPTWLLLALPMEGFGSNKCQCVTTTSSIIPPRVFLRIEIIPPGAHCRKTEILWVMMFRIYTSTYTSITDMREMCKAVHVSSVPTNLIALKNVLHYSLISPRSSQTNVTYSLYAYQADFCKTGKYCCICLLNVFKFLGLPKRTNKQFA